jgi:hypothetical protein
MHDYVSLNSFRNMETYHHVALMLRDPLLIPSLTKERPAQAHHVLMLPEPIITDPYTKKQPL